MKTAVVVSFIAVFVVFACNDYRRKRHKTGGTEKKLTETGTVSLAKTLVLGVRGFRSSALPWIPILTNQRNPLHLYSLIENGVSGSILPAFPTTPAPNYHTIATGKYPAKNGIVADEFYDKDLGLTINVEHGTRAFNKESVEQYVTKEMGKQIFGGVPIWETLEGQVACVNWPGCEFGVDERNYLSLDQKIFSSWTVMVKKVKEWLEDSSIKLVLVDYTLIEVASRGTPSVDAIKQMLKKFDPKIEELARGLADEHLLRDQAVQEAGQNKVSVILRKLNLNLIIVGSSGISWLHVDKKPKLPVPDKSTENMFDVWTMQPTMWLVQPKENQMQNTLDHFKKYSQQIPEVYENVEDPTANTVPKKWRYTGNKRIASLIVTAFDGTKLSNKRERTQTGTDELAEEYQYVDGYGIRVTEMSPAFIAYGPSFKQGQKVDANNMGAVNVHLLLCKLAKVDPPPGTDSVRHVHDYGERLDLSLKNPDEYIDEFLN